jgi:hypothetical protein
VSTDPDKKLAARKRYREAHKDDPAYKAKAAQRTREWTQRNRDRALEYGRQRRADPAFAEAARARSRAWYEKHKDDPEFRAKERARGREYEKRPEVKAHISAYRAEYRKRPEVKARLQATYEADPAKFRARVRRSVLKHRYGLTPEELDTLIAAQGGKCAICGEVPRRFHVDHDHKTGARRGFLCGPCNTALGLFKDDPKRLRAAIRYLAR